MESLSQQISPYATMQPNPDQTFRQYVESLLGQRAPLREFSGPFAGQQDEQSQAAPTTNITEGLFSRYLSDGGGGDSVGVGSSPASGSFTSANDVVAMDQMAAALNSMAGKQAVSEVVGMITGNPIAGIVASTLAGPLANAAANQGWSSFNQGIDASNAAFGTAAALGGVGTISNNDGFVSSITTPAMVDAYDTGMFGITGSGLAALGGGGDDGGFGGGFGDSGPSGSSGAGGASAAGPGESDGAGVGADGSGGGDGGGGGGGGKIVCTAMNHAYGFGSFRQAVWLQYSKDNLSKAHEVGYHTMFLPLVDIAYKQDKRYSKPIRKTLEHIARHRTADLRAEMRNTKRDTLGRAYRFVLEPLCYIVGKVKGY